MTGEEGGTDVQPITSSPPDVTNNSDPPLVDGMIPVDGTTAGPLLVSGSAQPLELKSTRFPFDWDKAVRAGMAFAFVIVLLVTII